MTTEEWKPIVGHANYEVSSHGRVRRVSGGKGARAGYVLKSILATHGYHCATLTQDGIQTRYYIHRLVAFAFLPPDSTRNEVNHIDGNKTNNSVANLEWATTKENSRHAIRTGLHVPPKGARNGRSKLNDDLVRTLRKRFVSGETRASLAREFSMDFKAMSRAVLGITWKHVA